MPDILEIESELGINTKAAIIESIEHPILDHSGIHLHIKRDDLLHPIISGNKWRKLKYTLLYALTKGHEHLISMGGPYSNHLHALAYIGHKLNLKTTGLIRGEQPTVDNYTLADMKKWGMNLKFITRGAFRDLRKYRNHDAEPAKKYNGFWIAEGGACHDALCGTAEIVKEIDTSNKYREFEVNFKNFYHDLNEEKESLKFTDLELIFKDLKSLFEKRGFVINWKELEKQSLDETINALAMASPFSLEEKQFLLEAKNLDIRKNKIAEILSTYAQDVFNNTTIQ